MTVKRVNQLCSLLLLCAVMVCLNGKSLAQAGDDAASKAQPTIDQESETQALQLVETHLPELSEVLKRLQSKEPRHYDQAIRDLLKSARKLEQVKNRDERLYDIEVEVLKSQSAVNLLTAKLKVRDSQADRKSLREALKRLQEAQVTRAQYDVAIFQERLERTQDLLDAAKKRLESKQPGEAEFEERYMALLHKAGREKKASAPATDK
jgi:hypothetical protein